MKLASELSIINLDANASVPPLPEAKQALMAALDLNGNASSAHALGRKLRCMLDVARENVAHALGGNENELFFCSGASEGNRWLVDALVHSGEVRGRPFRVLVSPLEHPSLMKCLESKAAAGKIELEKMSLEGGKLKLEDNLGKAQAVFITAAHNETGYLPNWAELIPWIAPDAILISDAAQAVGRIEGLPRRVDAIVASSHKMGGVVGAGAVLLRGQAQKLSAPWSGGGQEAGLRPGSESVPLIAAMGEAARLIGDTRQKNQQLAELRDSIEAELLEGWPFAFLVGHEAGRLPQTSAICVNGVDPEALRINVDQARICVGFGSACSALAPEPSPALLAFGLTPSQARATIRISLSPELSRDAILEGITRLKDLVIGMKAQN
jgi:cysteine desulfurase